MNANPNQAKAIFLEAVQKCAPDLWPAFLDQACADQLELRRRVEALLQAHREAGAGSAEVGNAAPAPPTVGKDSEQAGNVLGPYKLLEQIGEGGMGTVWVAQQTEPIKRTVAIKLIRPGLDSRHVLGRFEAERQALALMDHPNIAKVLDAGTTEYREQELRARNQGTLTPDSCLLTPGAGRPYFVMELVKGIPITRFCDEHRLTPRQRLELFIPVCQALQHAHQKGIIHRDIKPSNVLVALYDDRPVPKVIDFGVAKATGQELTEQTLHTGFGAVVGTVEYMSPEQASFNQLDVDTRSDIYSLGVLLYELLVGSTPLERQRVKESGILEALRIIREDEVPTLSNRVSTTKELGTIAANRGLEPAGLSRLVRGELDWIVTRALEKDRNRRYATASDLAMDLQRHLADEPVQACPPSMGYRLRKFVRRNRGPVIAASLVALALILGLAGTTAGLIWALQAEADAKASALLAQNEKTNAQRELERAVEAEADAKTQRDKAIESERQAKEAEADTKAFSDFLVNDVLAVARPAGERGGLSKDVTVRAALDAAVPKLSETFKDRPLAEAIARHDLGVTYRLVGEPALAEPHLRRAVELRGNLLGPDHPDALNSANSLAVLLKDLGKVDEALRVYAEILPLKKVKLGPNHPDTLSTMNNLAQAYWDAGRLGEAVTLHDETLALRRATLGSDHPETLTSMNNLALAYMNTGRLPKALPLLEETLRLRKSILGLDHPETLRSLSNLAVAYERSGRLAEAIPMQEEALRRKAAQQGPDHPNTLTSMNQLAVAYRQAGKQAEALALFEEVLKRRRTKLGPDHPDTLSSMNNLATVYTDAARLADAIALFDEVLALRKAQLGPTHPQTLNSMNNLAVAYELANQPGQAEPLYRALMAALREKSPVGSPALAHALTRLGRNLLQLGKTAEAEQVLRESLIYREKKLPDDWATFLTQSLWGDILLGQGKYAEAEPFLLQGYEGLKQCAAKIPKEEAPRLTEALERLVNLYDAWGKPDQAAEWRKKLEAQKKESGVRNPESEKKPMPN